MVRGESKLVQLDELDDSLIEEVFFIFYHKIFFS
jgi:hypothetical protein